MAKYNKRSEELGIQGVSSISSLEAEIMKIIWDRGQATVRKVHEIMLKSEVKKKQENFIPYTTVMSTMSSLADKGLLRRKKDKKSYLYTATMDNQELSRNIIESVSKKLLANSSRKLVSEYLEENKEIDQDKIKELLDKIKKQNK